MGKAKGWKRGALYALLLFLAYQAGTAAAGWQETLQQTAETEDETEMHQIAITFDDGPNPAYTPVLLDGLKERGVHASFFLLGEEAERYPELVKRIQAEGHLIGIHSYQHVNFKEIGTEAALAQIERTQQVLKELCGSYAGYIRPPYGCWQDELDAETDLIEVLWTVDPRDWAADDAALIMKRILADADDGAIILLHDASDSSVQAAFFAIDALQKEGYTFVTVEELLLE